MTPTHLPKKIITALLAICLSLPIFAQQESYHKCLRIYRDGDVVKTIECLSDFLEKKPKDASALGVRAYCYAQLRMYARAFTDVNNAIKYYTKKSDYHIMMFLPHVAGKRSSKGTG